MKLRDHAPKKTGRGVHREVSAEETYERMLPHQRRIGITRIADITGLDRIGIPVYNTICPRSHDVISVYNGKGTTRLEAKTSAIMEAVERFAASLPRTPAAIASYTELNESGRAALDPREFNLEPYRSYRIEMPISWVEGYDLMHERSVLVPMYLAGYYMWFHETPCFPIATTNGIASGNSLEEAICHALAELIERDDWTIGDLISNRLSQVVTSGRFAGAAADGVGLLEGLHPSINVESLPPIPLRLVELFESAGVEIELKDLTSPTGIPTIMATVSEEIGPTVSHSHRGLGTHPDADVAVLRAITEVAQSRVVDINALREDISLPGEDVERWLLHIQRTGVAPKDTWSLKPSATSVHLSTLPSQPSDDVVADIRLMLERLRGRGLDQAIVVNLSPPSVPANVVRMIVPGMESWVVDRSKLGRRAKAALNSMLLRLFPDTRSGSSAPEERGP